MPSVHDSLLDLYKALGYREDEDGLCHGFSLRWLEAALLGPEELDRFERRVQYIATTPLPDLVQAIKDAKFKRGKALQADDYKSLDIIAFYESLEVFHCPHFYSKLFDQSYVGQQQIESASTRASSIAIEKRGGLKEIYSDSVILTEPEIKEYLNNLEALFKRHLDLNEEPIGILLQDKSHTVALVYKPGQGFLYRDINQTLQGMTSNAGVATSIMKGFSDDSPYSAFSVQIISTGKTADKHHERLKEELDLFKRSTPITKDTALRETSTINLTYVAARLGDAQLIDKLGKLGANLDKTTENGVTPGYIAAQNGHDKVIAKLAKWKANLNLTYHGVTLALIAARSGHAEVIAQLAELGVDLNITLDGETPVFVAAQEGHAEVILQLARAGADLNIAHNGATPTFIAAQLGHVDSIKQLLAHGADFKIPFIAKKTDLLMFAQSQSERVAERMTGFLNRELNNETVKVKPYDIAQIMGHYHIVNCIKEQNNYCLTGNGYKHKKTESGIHHRHAYKSKRIDSGDDHKYKYKRIESRSDHKHKRKMADSKDEHKHKHKKTELRVESKPRTTPNFFKQDKFDNKPDTKELKATL